MSNKNNTKMTDDTKVYDIAQKILNKVNQKENTYGIITILMIISIVLTAIRIIQECNKNRTKIFNSAEKNLFLVSEIKSKLKHKNWFTKMKLKKVIRNELGKDLYKIYGTQILDTILESDEFLIDDEIYTLIEVKNV